MRDQATTGRAPNDWLAPALLLTLLALVPPLQALTQPFNHDEEQYVAAAVLARDLLPYRDFLYLQTPLQPLLLAPLLAAVEAPPFVLARLASAAFGVVALVLVHAVAWRLSGRRLVAGVAAALFVTSSTMWPAFGTARNDILPICLALLGVWLALKASDRRGHGLVALAGAVLALALSAKLSAGFAGLAVMIGLAWIVPRLLPAYLLGGVAGLLPTAVLAALAPDAFVYGSFTYHLTAPYDWYVATGREAWLSHGFQWAYLARAVSADPALLAALALLLGGLIALRRHVRPSYAVLRRRGGLIVLLAAALGALAYFGPRPPWQYYLQPAVPFLILGAAALPTVWYRRRHAYVFAGLAGLAVAVQTARLSQQWVSPADWVPTRLHALAQAIAAQAGAGPVATLSPVLVLDGGGAILPELASGPFFFRTGTAELAATLPALAPMSLDESFDPPAILVGMEPVAETALRDWARARGYVAQPPLSVDFPVSGPPVGPAQVYLKRLP
ncbi:MAG: hypothetical protein RIM84_18310 [Alphaproteobacteria bacterium]